MARAGRIVGPIVVLAAAAPLVPRIRALARPWLLRLGNRLEEAATMTAAEIAGELWGEDEANSHSAGAQRVRGLARELFPDEAPGHGGEWRFSPRQVSRLERQLREA